MASPVTQPKTQNQPATAKTTPTTTTATTSTCQLRALTEKLAYEIWEKNGRKHGQDTQNWYEAEKVAKQRLGV
jgi:hypothetical protein